MGRTKRRKRSSARRAKLSRQRKQGGRCRRKVAMTRMAAFKERRRLEDMGEHVVAYKCRFCGDWHVGHVKGGDWA